MTEEINADIAKAVEAAEATPPPAVETMFDDVYASRSRRTSSSSATAVLDQIQRSGAIAGHGREVPALGPGPRRSTALAPLRPPPLPAPLPIRHLRRSRTSQEIPDARDDDARRPSTTRSTSRWGRTTAWSCLGEDIGKKGGVFGATAGLLEKFGELRVMDTPLSECGILGTAIGHGPLRPARRSPRSSSSTSSTRPSTRSSPRSAKFRYRSGGEYPCPVVIRSPSGGGIKGGHYHSQSAEAYFIHTPGLRVVMPTTPRDAKGLLLASIFQDDPVMFLEPKALYRHAKEEVPRGLLRGRLGEGPPRPRGRRGDARLLGRDGPHLRTRPRRRPRRRASRSR